MVVFPVRPYVSDNRLYGVEFLEEDIKLNLGNGVWQTSNWKLTLPEAGIYRIFGNIRVRIDNTSGQGHIVARMWNETDDVLPPDAETMLVQTSVTTLYQTTVSVERIIEVEKETVLRFEAYRNGTFDTNGSTILSNEFGRSLLGWQRVG